MEWSKKTSKIAVGDEVKYDETYLREIDRLDCLEEHGEVIDLVTRNGKMAARIRWSTMRCTSTVDVDRLKACPARGLWGRH
jgi:hypothetical protein